jgi:hypothetical protein
MTPTHSSLETGAGGKGVGVKHGYLSLEQPPDFDDSDIGFPFAICCDCVYQFAWKLFLRL